MVLWFSAESTIQNECEAHARFAHLTRGISGLLPNVSWQQRVRAIRPRRRQPPVDVIAGHLERLHRPVGRDALRPFLALFVENPPDQVGSDALRIAPKLLDQFDIPKLMQVFCAKPALPFPPASWSSAA